MSLGLRILVELDETRLAEPGRSDDESVEGGGDDLRSPVSQWRHAACA